MLVIFILLFILYSLLFFLARKEKIPEELSCTGLQKLFRKIGTYLYQKSEDRQIYGKQSRGYVGGSLLQTEQVQNDLRALKPAIPVQKSSEQYYISKISVSCMVLMIGTILAFAVFLSNEMTHILENGVYISRNDYEGGSSSIEIAADIEDLETTDVTISVGNRRYSTEELDKMYEQVLPLLEKKVLGKNTCVDAIESDLEYVAKIDGFPFSMRWSSEGRYLDSTGRIRAYYETNEKVLQDIAIGPDGVIDTLKVKVTYYDYEREYSFPIQLIPRQKSMEELVMEELDRLLNKAEKDTITEAYIKLPEQVAEHHVEWQEKKENLGGMFLGLIGLAFVILYIGKDKELHTAVVKREQQLLSDYPEIVSKVSLLTGAGMTVRNAWKKVACDYREKRENGYKVHYAYEEMLIAVYEMDSGVSEAQAYENFGKRCKLQHYIKFATLLNQNLRKGAAGLFEILQDEATEAFEIRKSIARKLGEEAGTKLLFPMMLMLGIVIVMIFYPAFSSYAS